MSKRALAYSIQRLLHTNYIRGPQSGFIPITGLAAQRRSFSSFKDSVAESQYERDDSKRGDEEMVKHGSFRGVYQQINAEERYRELYQHHKENSVPGSPVALREKPRVEGKFVPGAAELILRSQGRFYSTHYQLYAAEAEAVNAEAYYYRNYLLALFLFFFIIFPIVPYVSGRPL